MRKLTILITGQNTLMGNTILLSIKKIVLILILTYLVQKLLKLTDCLLTDEKKMSCQYITAQHRDSN